MPPLRTITAPKPLKTERTHEENQERAYIAASRRSDRSLEARVESARRASEIHKRRTGRSLRVTEQDVVNEEMYEEEDDDLPMQYRRLTAHLTTSNAEFDRRLAAYLTNHVAMRTALGQAVSESHGHMYPNAPQFANQMHNPMMNSMGPPNNGPMRSPTMYRQSPYPTPGSMNSFRGHSRANSIATPQELNGFQNPFSAAASPSEKSKLGERRMSMPANTPDGSEQVKSPDQDGTDSSTPNIKQEPNQQSYFPKQPMQMPMSSMSQGLRPSGFPTGFNMGGNFDSSFMNLNPNPFSPSLPTESQQLLSGAFDPNDYMTAMLMGNASKAQQPFYSYNPTRNQKKSFNSPAAFDGMSQTLAPSVLDTASAANNNPSGPFSANSDAVFSPFDTDAPELNFESNFMDQFKPSGFTNSTQTSGQVTPSIEKDWQSLIDGNAWEEQPSSQTADT